MSRVTTVACAALIAAVSLAARAQQAQEQKPDPQRPPTFRSGAHFVSLDAYPVRDGKAITGLTVNDFVLLEDGKPQTIDLFTRIDIPYERPEPLISGLRRTFSHCFRPAYEFVSVGAPRRSSVRRRQRELRMMGNPSSIAADSAKDGIRPAWRRNSPISLYAGATSNDEEFIKEQTLYAQSLKSIDRVRRRDGARRQFIRPIPEKVPYEHPVRFRGREERILKR